MISLSAIFYPLTGAIGVLALAHVLPLLVAMALGDGRMAWVFALAGMLTAFCAGAMAMSTRDTQRSPRMAERLAFLSLVWLVVPAFAAISFVGADPEANFVDVYFEAVSAFTTTGATIMHDFTNVPPSLLVWRAMLQWYGGFLTVLLVMVVLAQLGLGGLVMRRAAIPPGYTSGPFGRYWPAIAVLGGTYLAITFLCLIGLLADGMPLIEAICLAFSSISTGGMVVVGEGFGAAGNPLAYVILLFAMLLGATNFTRHAGLIPRRPRDYLDDPEHRYLAATALVFGLAVTVLIYRHETSDMTVAAALAHGFFWAISLMTTTVFPVAEDSAFTAIPLVVALGAVFIGGCVLSTAGGLKLMRVALMLKQGTRELARLAHPHAIVHSQYGGRPFSMDVMKSVWSYFVTMVVCTAATCIALAAGGLPFEQSVAAGVGAITNAGPVLGFALDDAGIPLGTRAAEVYAALPVAEKLVLCIAMTIGRVEVLAFLAVGGAILRRDN